MATALSLNEIRHRCAQVVVDWRDEPGEERQQAQSFVRDLLAAFGITKTKAARYERRAQRASTGGAGYIDALIPGLALIEMKTKGRDLVKAEEQALDYLDDLPDAEQPRWIITSDFARIRLLDLEAEPGEDGVIAPLEFGLEDLPAQADALAFLAGYQVRSFGSKEQEKASVKAAQLMAHLYEALEGSGYDDHEASVFLVRTLFALYADDSGMWERDLFFEFLEQRTREDGSDLGPQLALLYQALNKPVEARQRNLDELIARFPYVNGGIFAEPLSIPTFDADMRALLLEACDFNWSGISPAIFGSLFQAVKDAKARRALGEHYTTETNILKTINPLFMDELRERFAAGLHSKAGLKRLRADLGRVRVLDPACGCGNFLVVAYRELRALDLQILERLQTLGDTSQIPTLFFGREDLPVTLDHFYGIEIEEWPARIATTALHLVDHQANQCMELALGKAPEPLPLQTLANIHVANALRTDWADVLAPSDDVRVVGNPPFLGPHSRTKEQLAEMQDVWGSTSLGRLDYVTCWFKKAADYLADTAAARFAFVSTSSVAQGDQVARLFPPLLDAGWRIRFAHQTFAWTSEAPGMAHVHCVITGFDRGEKSPATLYTYAATDAEPTRTPARHINPYLIDGPDVIVTSRSTPLAPDLAQVVLGSMAKDGGHLVLDADEHDRALADPRAARYVRPYLGSEELLHNGQRWCLWLEDAAPADLAASSLLREHVEAVRAFRLGAKAESTNAFANIPHLFTQRAAQPTSFVCIPRVSSERRYFLPVARLEAEVIASEQNYQVIDPDGFQFSILSSSMLLVWQKAIGGRLESRLRFAVRTVWNNLPLPPVNDKARAQIIAAGQGVLDARALHAERSLAEHYNPLAMDPALLKAHAALDRAVDKAFGAAKVLRTDDERLALLFNRYAEMASAAGQ